MKRILSIIASAAVLFSAYSCVEQIPAVNETLDYTRCFTPTDLVAKVLPTGDDVEFNWTKSLGSTEFVLEIYNDAEFASLVKKETIKKDDLPYVVELEADMVYYYRVQGVDGNGVYYPSKWAESANAIETYAVKSSVSPEVVSRSTTSITIKWNLPENDTEIDHIRIYPAVEGDAAYSTFNVTDATVSSLEVTGLKASSQYTLAVHFKSANRGEVITWTRPETGGSLVVKTAQELISALATRDPILVDTEETLEIGTVEVIPPVVIYGKSQEDGTKPTISASFAVNAGTKAAVEEPILHFEDIVIDGKGYSLGHTIDIKKDVEISSITIRNSQITGFGKGLIYVSSGVLNTKKIELDGLLFEDCDGNGGDCFDVRNASVIEEILVKNSTFSEGMRTFFRIDAKGTVGKFTFQNNTLNNVCAADNSNNQGIFNVRGALDAANFIVKDNLILNMVGPKACFTGRYAATVIPTMSNNWFYNYGDAFLSTDANGNQFVTEETLTTGGGVILDEDPCVDSYRGKLNVTNAQVLEKKVGDPRWFEAYVEIPEDLTLGVTAPIKTWDLFDTKTFRGMADKHMVRDGIRFYVASDAAPINFTTAGFEFTTKATIGQDGVPTDGAIGILVDKPGSIVVSTVASASGSPLSAIGVSLDGKTVASVPAGLEYQKITFAEIEGEHMIYLYATDPIVISFLQWTDDVEVVKTVLDTPVLSVDKKEVKERAEDVINVTWSTVANAASYRVTVADKVYDVTETAYAIETKNFSVEEPSGEFEVSVVAVPAETDYIRSESEPASFKFTVIDVPIVDAGAIPGDGSEIADEYVLDFAQLINTYKSAVSSWDGTSSLKGDYSVSLDNVNFVAGENITMDPSKPRWQFGGKSKVGDDGIPTTRYISFKVTKPGVISHYIRHGSTGGYKADDESTWRMVKVVLAKPDGSVVELDNFSSPTPDYKAGSTELMTTEITAAHLAGLTAAPTVYIYSVTNGVNLRALEWKAQEGGAEINDPTAINEALIADFTKDGGYPKASIADGETLTIDKFTFGGNAEFDDKRYKFKGASKLGEDGVPANRFVSFKITKPGTITHKVISGSSSDATRKYAVALVTKVGDSVKVTELYNDVSPTSSGADAKTSEVTAAHLEGITEAAVVYIYTLSNCNAYAAGFTPAQ